MNWWSVAVELHLNDRSFNFKFEIWSCYSERFYTHNIDLLKSSDRAKLGYFIII